MLPAHHAVIIGLCVKGTVQSLILKNKLKITRRATSSDAFSLTVATIDQGGYHGKHVNSNTNCRTNISRDITVHTSVRVHIYVKRLIFL
jgi:hypothetical protein